MRSKGSRWLESVSPYPRIALRLGILKPHQQLGCKFHVQPCANAKHIVFFEFQEHVLMSSQCLHRGYPGVCAMSRQALSHSRRNSTGRLSQGQCVHGTRRGKYWRRHTHREVEHIDKDIVGHIPWSNPVDQTVGSEDLKLERIHTLPHHKFLIMRFINLHSGGLGAEGVFARRCFYVPATVRNRPQPSATIRNRSQLFARFCYMAVPMISSAEGVLFGGFKRLVAFFRVAGMALRDIRMCFVTCRKPFCVWQKRNTFLRRFHKMRCSFRGRRSTLGVSIVILRGRRNTLDVSCCVFFGNRIGRAASSGDKAQIPWQAWHFLRCAENWRKPRTKHRFWNSKISGAWENSRKTLILMLQSVNIGGSLARNARFGAPTRLVWSLWFSCGVAVSMGEAAKPLLFEGCHAGCHVVLRGRRGTL